MKRTSLSIVWGVAVLVSCLGFAAPAGATTLTIGDSRYLGLVNDGAPSSPANEVVYINNLLARPLSSGPTVIDGEAYTRSGITCAGCPTAVTTNSLKDDTSPATTLNVNNHWTYLLVKYDGQNYGSAIWYIAGLTQVTFPNAAGPVGGGSYGISHWSLYNYSQTDGRDESPLEVTPEPASLLLLGSGLVVIGARLRRRRA